MLPDREELKRWLDKAENDRRPAEALLALAPPVTDTAAFHCQQAVETYLKAILIHHRVDFEKIHDLRMLVLMCGDLEPGILSLEADVSALTPFAVRFRYPGPADPTVDAVKAALVVVGHVRALVRSAVGISS